MLPILRIIFTRNRKPCNEIYKYFNISKPSTVLLKRLCDLEKLKASKRFMIGDRITDIIVFLLLTVDRE